MPETSSPKKEKKQPFWKRSVKESPPLSIRVDPEEQALESEHSEQSEILDKGSVISGFDLNDSPDGESLPNSTVGKKGRFRRFIKNPVRNIKDAAEVDQDVPDDDESIEKKRAPMAVGVGIGCAGLLAAGCLACVIGATGTPIIRDLAGVFIKNKVSEGAGLESMSKYPGVSELVQQNGAIQVKEADGVSLDEYKRNIKVRNEIIGSAQFNKNYGLEADMLVLNSSPSFAKRSVYEKPEAGLRYMASLLDAKYYKDGKARTSFSLGRLDEMNSEDREYVKSILYGVFNQSVIAAFLTDASRLPNDNIIRAYVTPFRRQYEVYNGRENFDSIVGVKLAISTDGKRYTILDSDLAPVNNEERNKDFKGLENVISFLAVFAGGSYSPAQGITR